MSQYVDQLLRDWARWKATCDDAGLGWPHQVAWVKERVQESRSASDYKSTDPEVIRIDACILRLPSKHRDVVINHYTVRGPAKAKAARLQINRQAYYEHLSHAQAFLEALLAECRDTFPVAR